MISSVTSHQSHIKLCRPTILLHSFSERNCVQDSWHFSDNPQTKPCSENTDRRGAPGSHTPGLEGPGPPLPTKPCRDALCVPCCHLCVPPFVNIKAFTWNLFNNRKHWSNWEAVKKGPGWKRRGRRWFRSDWWIWLRILFSCLWSGLDCIFNRPPCDGLHDQTCVTEKVEDHFEIDRNLCTKK